MKKGKTIDEALNSLQDDVEYRVRVSRAAMPGSVRSPYVHVGVVAVLRGHPVRLLADTTRQRVVQVWHRLYDGTGPRCARARAVVSAEVLAERLARSGQLARLARQQAAVDEALVARSGEVS